VGLVAFEIRRVGEQAMIGADCEIAQAKILLALGQRVGIEHTPTIWVVTANSKGAPFVEVLDRSRLYQMIDQAIADTASAPKPAVAKTPAKTAAKKPNAN